MRAVVRHEYGDTDVLKVEEFDIPVPTEKQVLVKVAAIGIDRGINHIMTGTPTAARLVFGLKRPKSPFLGLDIAGTVVAIGSEVTTVAVGDEVYGFSDAALAEYATARADRVAPLPRGIDAVHAAAVPVSALTALQAVRLAKLGPGSRVLITGAAGGVGSYLVQMAHSLGAHVTAVCSAAKFDFVKGLGADEAIDYASGVITGTFDAVFEFGGARPVRELRALLTPTGTLVIGGGEGGGRVLGPVSRTLATTILNPFTKQNLVGLLSTQNHDDLLELSRLMEEGAFTPIVDATYPLERAAEAIGRLDRGGVGGKLVVVTGA